jgi:activator of 2-hydroxyglutaryl-CoA dehydratase
MANRVGVVEPVMMTGGVAKNIGVVRALEKKSGKSIHASSPVPRSTAPSAPH